MSHLSDSLPTTNRPPESGLVKRPIFVDLDGTLIAGDLGQEAFFSAIHADPWLLLTAPYHAARGLAHFKNHLAQRVTPNVEQLSYHADVIEELKRLKAAGHPLILATASHRVWAEPVARQLNLFDDLLATDAQTNLKGPNKLAAIERYCHDHGWEEFEYWGDAPVDLRIWSAPTSARIVAVNPSSKTLSGIRATKKEYQVFANRGSRARAIVHAMRPQQWVKNVLLFVPLLLSHNWGNFEKIIPTVIAFIAFSLTASAVYIVNDTFDAAADRLHPKKRRRPFANGTLPLIWGPFLSLSLFFAGQLLIWICLTNEKYIAARASILLLGYSALNLWYSLALKRRMVIDVVCLAGMYTLRILIGGIAADVEISKWLLAFSFFIFTSLAFAKRYAELARLAGESAAGLGTPAENAFAAQGHSTKAPVSAAGRGYSVHDLSIISSVGPACGYMAILVLALYINSDEMTKLYKFTFPLWLLCPLLLYWITRLWFIAHRNELNEDPIVFALKDRISWGVIFLTVVLALSATYLDSFPKMLERLFS
jgi:4-hydroxybenzoate polyprenyltransferase/phosphoserine phosphatase